MPSDYQAKYILIGFYNENQSAGTSEDRAQWSEDAFTRYDRHIVEACVAAGLEPSVEARSIMAVLASMAPGTAPKTQARQAVKTYLEYRGI
jgi:hypothetical protein